MLKSSEGLISYFLTLHNISKNKKINEKIVDFRILNEFVEHEKCNIYQCHQSLLRKCRENEDYCPTYKTVHTKIHELAALEMIERDKTKSVDHGATEYRLSSFGVYYIIKNHHHKLGESSIIESNENDKLFEIFLYSFISKETVLKMKDYYIRGSIFEYLSTICKAIDRLLDIMKKIEYEGGVKDILTHSVELGMILDSASQGRDKSQLDLLSTSFFRYLELKHGIKLDDTNPIRIEKEDESSIRIILDGIGQFKFEIASSYDDDEHYAALYDENGNTMAEFDVSIDYKNYDGIYDIYEFTPICVEDFLSDLLSDKSTYSYIFKEIGISIHELCWKILHYLFLETNSYFDKLNKNTLSILANDPYFKKCIHEVEKDTKDRFKKFKELID